MKELIGAKKTRWFFGDKFIFEHVGGGEWKCVYQDSLIIPAQVVFSLND